MNTQYPIPNTRPLSRFTLHASRLASFTIHRSPFIVLAALILLAVWPLLTSGLPTVGDGLIHFYRFAALDWHVRHGDFYPRWFANLHYGFGAPVFNFYAPLSYYVPLLLRLFNLSLSTSLQLGYVLALATAIVGAYVWVRGQFSSALAGLVGAAAYGLAPYPYLTIFHRGAYPELWALALVPWLLWSTWRLTCDPNRKSLVIFVFLNAALILTHNVSALIFAPITLIYFILLSNLNMSLRAPEARGVSDEALSLLGVVRTPRNDIWRSLIKSFGIWFLGFGISLLLSAFFLLPVLFESQYVQLYRTTLPGALDYRNNFLTLAALFSPPPNFDPRLVFNAMPASLPWPQVVLAVVAVVSTISGQWAVGSEQSNATSQDAKPPLFIVHCSFFIALSFLTLSASAPLWSFFPLARFIQFPWRLVGPASLFLAALAAATLARFASTRLGIWVLGFGISFFFLFSLPWTYHSVFETLPSTVTPSDSIRYEIDSGHLGTSSAGEYLPRWVSELPAPDTLLASFAGTDTPSRLTPLPPEITHHDSRITLSSEELVYDSPSPFTATFNLFYFPGWTATLDGQPTAIRVSSPNGLITVPLPAGQHTLRLALRATPPQAIGGIVSLITLIALFAIGYPAPLCYRDYRRPSALTRPSLGFGTWDLRFSLYCSLFIVSLFIARIFYFDRFESPFPHSSINALPNPTAINFDDQLELIGFDYPKVLVSGGTLDLTLYWRALAPLATDYSTTVQLADRFGNRFGASDSQHPNGVPTSRWMLEQYARDSHHLVSLTGTPPGQYHLLVGAYARAPLSVLQEGAPAGIEYDLGPVTVSRALPQTPGALRLVNFELADDAVAVGDQLAFTVVWNSGDEPLPALTARLLLTDSADQTIFSADLPPAGEDYPTVKWTANELIRFPFSVGLPPDLVGGTARVSLLLVDASGETRAGGYDLATITVVVPPRSFSIPPMARRVDYDFVDSIRLLGYDLSAEGITLYWQALKPVSTRLTVFVHQLDSGGVFVAGHDSAPARPTTGWLAGEVIADVHPISVGDHFEVGLYDPITGERFGEPFVAHP